MCIFFFLNTCGVAGAELINIHTDAQVLIQIKALEKIHTDDATGSASSLAVKVVACYTISLLRYGYSDMSKDSKNYHGSLIKATLADIKCWVAVQWSNSIAELEKNNLAAQSSSSSQYSYSNFMSMAFNEWMNGLYDLVPSYRKREFFPNGDVPEFLDNETSLFKDQSDFITRVLEIIHVDVQKLTGYSREIMMKDEKYNLYRQAQQLDYYYACLVKGAAVKLTTDRVWCPAELQGTGMMDEKKFTDVVIDVIKKSMSMWTGKSGWNAMQNYRTPRGKKNLLSATQVSLP